MRLSASAERRQEVVKSIREEKGIDTSLFIDDDGTPYLYFVLFTGGNVIWVAEGPSVFRHKGIYYMLYSANHTRSQDYAVGYATASSPYGPRKKQSGNPVFRRDSPHAGGLGGIGHGAPFKYEDGDLMYVFHAHQNDSTMYPRTMYINKELKNAKNGTLCMTGGIILPVVVE